MYCVFPVFVIKNIKIDIISKILEKNIDKMNQNRKKPKKESGHEETLAKLVFITAILNLIQAIVDLIKEFS